MTRTACTDVEVQEGHHKPTQREDDDDADLAQAIAKHGRQEAQM